MQIAVDIGGTFTDLVGWDGARIHATKVPSVPSDLIAGVEAGVRELLAGTGHPPHAVSRFVHGTTVATNAVLEEKGARIGLLATRGFEDVLEIGRQKRSRMYDLMMDPDAPVFLAPGRRRAGITERIDAQGSVLVPLAEDEVEAAVGRLLRDERIEAVAVCYLFSFRNPSHERRTREIIDAAFPGLQVSLSSEVNPVFREYERTCVTAFDAYVRPKVVGYLDRLEGALARLGVGARVEVMQSRGGVASAGRAVERPVTTLLCGPAAGALGGKVAGERAGFSDLITLDMGGTSTDVSVVRKGRLALSQEGRIRGYPLRLPMLDVHTIGAGGGSIARIDEAGALRVGPKSAGAEPGPACYGRGGAEATVTDASLVLGFLDPDGFAGGIRLDRRAAEAAVGRVAAGTGLGLLGAAHGIHTVCNAAMADAIRMVTVRRGLDPRGFALVLLGGAGPVHGGALAPALGIRTLVVPPRPGVLAAEGLLAAPVEHDAHRTFAVPAREAEAPRMAAHLAELEAQGRGRLVRDGIDPERIRCRRSADMRYLGQSYELEVPLGADPGEGGVRAAVEAFYALYRQTYGHGSLEEEAEFVNLRVVLSAEVEPPAEGGAARGGGIEAARRGARPACFAPAEGHVETPVYERALLPAGARLVGPAIIAQPDTTTVVYPGQACAVHSSGALLVTAGGGA
ncbi:MAG: hydantoinase/oxoprolinase family protein [Proteobacteria bacterium]|nr:hydantoinase/oxoprolinase family protein [Pseudomonadota bacterium]